MKKQECVNKSAYKIIVSILYFNNILVVGNSGRENLREKKSAALNCEC